MNEFFSGSGVAYPISAFEILLNIGLAFVLGLFVVTVYRLTNRNQAMSASFVLTLMILGMVVAMVMMIIGNSVARAFSLVGALSIIRFRTSSKTTAISHLCSILWHRAWPAVSAIIRWQSMAPG